MIGKLIGPIVLIAAAYWFWNGPYQDMRSESYDESLERNAEDIKRCINAQEMAEGTTGLVQGTPREVCAAKYRLYYEEGHWHSYDRERPADWTP